MSGGSRSFISHGQAKTGQRQKAVSKNSQSAWEGGGRSTVRVVVSIDGGPADDKLCKAECVNLGEGQRQQQKPGDDEAHTLRIRTSSRP